MEIQNGRRQSRFLLPKVLRVGLRAPLTLKEWATKAKVHPAQLYRVVECKDNAGLSIDQGARLALVAGISLDTLYGVLVTLKAYPTVSRGEEWRQRIRQWRSPLPVGMDRGGGGADD